MVSGGRKLLNVNMLLSVEPERDIVRFHVADDGADGGVPTSRLC